MLKFLAQMFVNTYIFVHIFFACLVCCMCFRLFKYISNNATWISEVEMFYFMLSMYRSHWWWVHGCMDELQHTITTGVMRLVVYDIFIAHFPRLEHTIKNL